MYLYNEALPEITKRSATVLEKIKAIHAIILAGANYLGLEDVDEQVDDQDLRRRIKQLRPGNVRSESAADLLQYHMGMKGKGKFTFEGKVEELKISIPSPSETALPVILQQYSLLVERLKTQMKTVSTHEAVRIAMFLSELLTLTHPFFDGNGRTSRAFFTLLLMESGHPPYIIESTDPTVRQTTIDGTQNMIGILYEVYPDCLPDSILRKMDASRQFFLKDLIARTDATTDHDIKERRLSLEALLQATTKDVTTEDIKRCIPDTIVAFCEELPITYNSET